MTYISGTRTLQANPAEDLYSIVAADLADHPNWTFIEDVTLATYKYSVWRCGPLNSTGAPYYVFFHRTNANGTGLGIGLAEDWNTATKAFLRGAPTASTTARTPNADYSITGNTETSLYNAAAGGVNMLIQTVVLDTSSFDYWFASNNDGFWLGARVGTAAAQGIVCGSFDSLVVDPATNDPRPLMIGHNTANTTSAAFTVFTRHPFASGSAAHWWGAYEWYTNLTWPSLAVLGTVGGTTGDLFQQGKAVGARVVMRTFALQRTVTTQGQNRGLYRHMLWFGNAAGVTVGDTITIDSTTWVYTGKGGVYYEATAA